MSSEKIERKEEEKKKKRGYFIPLLFLLFWSGLCGFPCV
jgi:hypothetical protein